MTLHQLDFDGKEILGVYLDVPDFGRKEFPIDESLAVDDIIEVTSRYRVAFVNHGAKGDGQGMAKEQFARIYKVESIKSSFAIKGVSRMGALEGLESA